MRKVLLACLAAALVPAPACAAVTYTFYTNEPFAGGDLGFTYQVADYLPASDSWIDRNALSNVIGNISRVRFLASCPDGGGSSSCDQINVVSEGSWFSTLSFRYFADGAFSAPGTYAGRGSTPTSLTVAASAVGAVPEPATWLMMLFGFGFVGYAGRRKNARLAFSM